MLLSPVQSFSFLLAVLSFLGQADAAELRPIPQRSSEMAVEHVETGIDSRLKPNQWARITDNDSFQSMLRSHMGLIHASSEIDIAPVDFTRSMALVVVDRTDRKTSGIRVDKVFVDDEVVFFDYQWIEEKSEKQRRRPENVFGIFVIPRSERQLVLRRLVPDKQGESEYKAVASFAAIRGSDSGLTKAPSAATTRRTLPRSLNVTFASDPGNGQHDGVWGNPGDLWNLVSMGTTTKDTLRYADMPVSPVRMRITNHDGAWGIKGHSGIFHGYIYHNCQCVDLEATFLNMSPGRYRALVYAHGDAPNQNARIELVVGDRSKGEKATANDGSWSFRESDLKENVHYVKFHFDVKDGDTVEFISHPDGSGYSMFNAIQIEPDEETSR